MHFVSKLSTLLVNVSNQELDTQDMGNILKSCDYHGYTDLISGQQPYRLMKVVYDLFTQEKNDVKASIIGVGRDGHLTTMSFYNNIQVNVFDSYRGHQQFDNEARSLLSRPNVSFKGTLSDVKQILDSDLIIFDVHPHDGAREAIFIEELENNNYNGVVIITCISLTNGIKNAWHNITQKKMDVTLKAHWAGTGVVFFEPLQTETQNVELQSYKTRALIAERRVRELESIIRGLTMEQLKESETVQVANLIDFDDSQQASPTHDPFMTKAGLAATSRYDSFKNSAYGRRVINT